MPINTLGPGTSMLTHVLNALGLVDVSPKTKEQQLKEAKNKKAAQEQAYRKKINRDYIAAKNFLAIDAVKNGSFKKVITDGSLSYEALSSAYNARLKIDKDITRPFDNLDDNLWNNCVNNGIEEPLIAQFLNDAAEESLSPELLNIFNNLASLDDKANYLAIITKLDILENQTNNQRIKAKVDALNQILMEGTPDNRNYTTVKDSDTIPTKLTKYLAKPGMWFRDMIMGIGGTLSSLVSDSILAASLPDEDNPKDDEGFINYSQKELINYANSVNANNILEYKSALNELLKRTIINNTKELLNKVSPYYVKYKDDKEYISWSDDEILNQGINTILLSLKMGADIAVQQLANSALAEVALNWGIGDRILTGLSGFGTNATADVTSGLAVLYAAGKTALKDVTYNPIMAAYLGITGDDSEDLAWSYTGNLKDTWLMQTAHKMLTTGYILEDNQDKYLRHLELSEKLSNDGNLTDAEWKEFNETSEYALNPNLNVYDPLHLGDFLNGDYFGSFTDTFGQYGFSAASTLVSLGYSTTANIFTKALTNRLAGNISKKLITRAATSATSELSKEAMNLIRKKAMDIAIRKSRSFNLWGQSVAAGMVGSAEGGLEAASTYDEQLSTNMKMALEKYFRANPELFNQMLNNAENYPEEIQARMEANRNENKYFLDATINTTQLPYTEAEYNQAKMQVAKAHLDEYMSNDPVYQESIKTAMGNAMMAYLMNFWANSTINGLISTTLKLSTLSKSSREALAAKKHTISKAIDWTKDNKGNTRAILSKEFAEGLWYKKAWKTAYKGITNASGEMIEEISLDISNETSQAIASTFYGGYLDAMYNPETRDAVTGSTIAMVLNGGITGELIIDALHNGTHQAFKTLSKKETWKDGLYGFLGAGMGGVDITAPITSTINISKHFNYGEGTKFDKLKSTPKVLKEGFKSLKKDLTSTETSFFDKMGKYSPLQYRNSFIEAYNLGNEDKAMALTVVNLINNILDSEENQALFNYLPTTASFREALDELTESGSEIGVRDTKHLLAVLNALILSMIEKSEFGQRHLSNLEERVTLAETLQFDETGNIQDFNSISEEAKANLLKLADEYNSSLQEDELAKTAESVYNDLVESANDLITTYKNQQESVSTSLNTLLILQRISESAQQLLELYNLVKELNTKYENLYGDVLSVESKAALISGDLMFNDWNKRAELVKQDILTVLDYILALDLNTPEQLIPTAISLILSKYGSFAELLKQYNKAVADGEDNAIKRNSKIADIKERAKLLAPIIARRQLQLREALNQVEKYARTLEEFKDAEKIDISKVTQPVLTAREIFELDDNARATILNRKNLNNYSKELQAIIEDILDKGNDYLSQNAEISLDGTTLFEDAIKDVVTLEANQKDLIQARLLIAQNPERLLGLASELKIKEKLRVLKIEHDNLLNSDNWESYEDQEEAIERKATELDNKAGIENKNSNLESYEGNLLRRLSIGNDRLRKFKRLKSALGNIITINRVTNKLFDTAEDGSIDFNSERMVAAIKALISLRKYSLAQEELSSYLSMELLDSKTRKPSGLSETVISSLDAILKSGEYLNFLDKKYVEDAEDVLKRKAIVSNNDSQEGFELTEDNRDIIIQETQNLFSTILDRVLNTVSSTSSQKPKIVGEQKSKVSKPTTTVQSLETPLIDSMLGKKKTLSLTSQEVTKEILETLNNNYGFLDFIENYDNKNGSLNCTLYRTIIGGKAVTLLLTLDKTKTTKKPITIGNNKYGVLGIIDITDATVGLKNGELKTANGKPYNIRISSVGENTSLRTNAHDATNISIVDTKTPYSLLDTLETIEKFLKGLGKVGEHFLYLGQQVNFILEFNKLKFSGNNLLEYLKAIVNSEKPKLPVGIGKGGTNLNIILLNLFNIFTTNYDSIDTWEKVESSIIKGNMEDAISSLFANYRNNAIDKLLYIPQDAYTIKLNTYNENKTITIIRNSTGDSKVFSLAMNNPKLEFFNLFEWLVSTGDVKLDCSILRNNLESYLEGNATDFTSTLLASYAGLGVIETQPFNAIKTDRTITVQISSRTKNNSSRKTTVNTLGKTVNPVLDNVLEPQEEAVERIKQQALAKAEAIVDLIKQDSKKLLLKNDNGELDSNADSYTDEDGNKYNRVTNILHLLKGYVVEKFTKNAYEVLAQGIGNAIDDTISSTLDYLSTYYDSQWITSAKKNEILTEVFKVFEKEYDPNNPIAFSNLSGALRELVILNVIAMHNIMTTMGWHVVPHTLDKSSEIKAIGNIKTSSGLEQAVSGTLDLLVYDNEGKFRIIDFKTFRSDDIVIGATLSNYKEKLEQHRDKWEALTNLYKLLLLARYPDMQFAEDALYILPFAVLYSSLKEGESALQDSTTRQVTITNSRGQSRELILESTDAGMVSSKLRNSTDLLNEVLFRLNVDLNSLEIDNTKVSIEDQSFQGVEIAPSAIIVTQEFTEETVDTETPIEASELTPTEKAPILEPAKPKVRTLGKFTKLDDDDFQESIELELYNQHASNWEGFTIDFSSNGKEETDIPKSKSTKQINSIIVNTMSKFILERLGVNTANLFDVLKIDVNKLIANPARFTKVLISRTLLYYNSLLNTELQLYKKLQVELEELNLLYDVFTTSISSEEFLDRLNNLNLGLEYYPLLSNYLESTAELLKTIRLLFLSEYESKQAIQEYIKNRQEILLNSFNLMREVVGFLQNQLSAITIISSIEYLKNTIRNKALNSGIKNFNNYTISLSKTSQPTNNTLIETLLKSVFKNLLNGTTTNIINVLDTVLTNIGEKHPMYQVLHNLGQTLYNSKSPLSITIGQSNNNNLKGKTITTSTDSYGNTEMILYIDNISNMDDLVHVLAHETVHAITSLILEESPLFLEDLQLDIDYIKDYVNSVYIDNYETCTKIYGLNSPKEFIAEFYSNPRFREMLRQIKVREENTNIFKKALRTIIKHVFKKSMLDEVTPKMERLLLTTNYLQKAGTERGNRKDFLRRLNKAQRIVNRQIGRFNSLSKEVQEHIKQDITEEEFNQYPTEILDCVINCAR